MPRTLRRGLRRMLERANPNVATFVELAVPDSAKVLRRAVDQFLQSPDPLVSMSPAVSAGASPSGALTLASANQTLISQMVDSGTYFFLPQEQGSETFHGTVGWQLSPAFTGALLRAVTVKLRWSYPLPDVALQIYKVHRTVGTFRRTQGTSTVETLGTQYSFAPLLAEPIVKRWRDVGVIGTTVDVAFDLTPYHLAIDPLSAPPPGPNESGDLAEYFFEISPVMQGQGNFVAWVKDTTSSRNLANIGLVREVGWQRGNPNDPASLWVRTDQNYSLAIKIDVEQYVATSQEVYSILLPKAPAADSTGRVVFRQGEPSGTSAALELSTAGSSGPWTAVKNGDEISVRQTQYHARLTMNASSDQRRAPIVSALGVEFRTAVDISAESTLEPMTQGVSVPFLQASVGEGSVSVVRTGRRDYRDVIALIASQGPDTQLELDAYVGSRHPSVTRADWFHTTRAQVSGRTPSGTTEQFSLLSLAKTLKRKIPARIESISMVHTVIGSPAPTTTQIRVSPNLSGASTSGNEYDGQGYYMRVRKSSQPGVETGMTFVIDGNTGVDKLDFPANANPLLTHELPGTLAVGDEIEVHSGRYQQPAISWVNADPADVWHDILTVHLGVPEDRIGLADVGASGRGGRPPKVTDRAPGDAVTQAKCCVTLKLTDAEDGDALIDQLSFLMGGATIEIAGQIVFRQIYPLRDAAGNMTVAPDPVVATFDARDYMDLDTPTGREQRITVLACDYGVDTTSETALPTATATYADADALATYQLQDVEGLGTAAAPDEIARWCFNSTDGGLFLASQVAQQVVQACSTGVRLWPFTTIDAHPELTVGDTVLVITDRYTDYDPARDAPVKGWAAYPLVLVSTAAGGRRFVGFLQGLGGVASVDVRGGDGTLQDNNPVASGVGPSLEMQITHGSSNATIDYSAANGTIALYVDGAGPSAVPASPIVVARPGAGAHPVEYAIKITGTDGQVIRNSVTVLPVDADTNTVTPDLVVTPSVPTTTTQRFDVSATNPGGGAAPLVVVTLRGTSGTDSLGGAMLDGGSYSFGSGGWFTVNRPAFGTTVQASVTVTASISGGGSESIQRTILNQVKTTFGPSLTTSVTYGGSSASIAYVGAGGTVEVSINGGAYSTAAASPIVVTRPAVGSLPITYDFRITADGETVSAHAVVLPVGFGPSLTVTATPGGSSYSISYSYAGTLTLAIDGGSDGAAASSPIVVTRDSNNHTYRFKAVLDDQTITREVYIPALASTGAGPSITGILAYNADYPADGGGGFDISWVSNNLSGDCTFDIAGIVTVGNFSGTTAFTSTGNTASPVHINHALGPSAPHVRFTITAKQDGVVVCTGIFQDAAVAL